MRCISAVKVLIRMPKVFMSAGCVVVEVLLLVCCGSKFSNRCPKELNETTLLSEARYYGIEPPFSDIIFFEPLFSFFE